MSQHTKLANRIVLWAEKFGFSANYEAAGTGTCYVNIDKIVLDSDGDEHSYERYRTIRIGDHDQSLHKRQWADYEIRSDARTNPYSDANIAQIEDIIIDLADEAAKPYPSFVRKFIAAKENAAAEKAAQEKIKEEQQSAWAIEDAALQAEAEVVKNSFRGANSWRAAIPFIVACTKKEETARSILENKIACLVDHACNRSRKSKSRNYTMIELFKIFDLGCPENRIEWREAMDAEGFKNDRN